MYHAYPWLMFVDILKTRPNTLADRVGAPFRTARNRITRNFDVSGNSVKEKLINGTESVALCCEQSTDADAFCSSRKYFHPSADDHFHVEEGNQTIWRVYGTGVDSSKAVAERSGEYVMADCPISCWTDAS